MIVTVPGVVDTTHPDANDYTLTWLPSHKTLIVHRGYRSHFAMQRGHYPSG